MQDLPFILCLDRSGLVGEDGPTHHGILDICMFISMPKVIIAAPKDGNELRNLFYTALNSKKGFVIRYPKGTAIRYNQSKNEEILEIGKWEILEYGEKCSILAVGSMVDIVMNNYDKICNAVGFHPKVINARFIKPIDIEIMNQILSKNDKIITIEEGTKIGGFGSFVLNYANKLNYKGKIKILGIDDNFIEQGARQNLLEICGLTAESVIKNILDER